jgi:release factor glutamine methyltransferase
VTAPAESQTAGSPAALLRQSRPLCSRQDAEFLLAALLRSPRHRLFDPQARVPGPLARRFLRLCRRAGTGEPPQYLARSAPFLCLDLYVDRRVVVPRPETEELVLRAARRSPIAGRQSPLLLDYGTGSGCVAIALARRFPRARVLAADSSAPALAVARRNVLKYRLGRRIRLCRASSLRDPVLVRLRGRLDLLVSNPPYVPSARFSRLSRRVRCYEPRSGLDGGPNGASIVEMLLRAGPELLRPGGLLALEIDHTHGPLARRSGAAVERDPAGRIRYAFLTRRS